MKTNALTSGRDGCGGMAVDTMSSYENDVAERIARSIAYMTEHLNEPLQVSDLAARANVSPSHYFALFKRYTGSAPIDFFTRLRMEYARELLETTSMSVKEIAGVLGYDDPFYFSRVFKSVNNVSPTDFRKVDKNLRESTAKSVIASTANLKAGTANETTQSKTATCFGFLLGRRKMSAAWKAGVSAAPA